MTDNKNNSICFLMGVASIKEKNFNLTSVINKALYPNFNMNEERFNKVMTRTFTNIVNVITSLGSSDTFFECNDLEFITFLLTEKEDKVTIKLLVNSTMSNSFAPSEVVQKTLSELSIGVDLIELGEAFIANIGGTLNKEIESEISIENFLGLNTMGELYIGFKDGDLRSEFHINEEFFNKPITQKEISEKLSNTLVPKAVDDISAQFQHILLEHKDLIPEDGKSIIVSIGLTSNKKSPVNISVAVNTENEEVLRKVDAIMGSEIAHNTFMYIVKEIINF